MKLPSEQQKDHQSSPVLYTNLSLKLSASALNTLNQHLIPVMEKIIGFVFVVAQTPGNGILQQC
jgi:hypothetical protein